jgi:hypothetical protein
MNDSQEKPTKLSELMELQSPLNWMEIANFVCSDSHTMQDWERQSLDEFTWAEFEA